MLSSLLWCFIRENWTQTVDRSPTGQGKWQIHFVLCPEWDNGTSQRANDHVGSEIHGLLLNTQKAQILTVLSSFTFNSLRTAEMRLCYQEPPAFWSVSSHQSLGSVSRPNVWLKQNTAAIGFHQLSLEPEVRREETLYYYNHHQHHTHSHRGVSPSWCLVPSLTGQFVVKKWLIHLAEEKLVCRKQLIFKVKWWGCCYWCYFSCCQ